MTNERAAKIILDLINAGEAEYRNFSVAEIRALKKAYVALNPEPVTNADRIRSLSDGELADFLDSIIQDWHQGTAQIGDSIIYSWLEWLKEEAKGAEG